MMDCHGARLTRNVTPADCGKRVDRGTKIRMIIRILVHMS